MNIKKIFGKVDFRYNHSTGMYLSGGGWVKKGSNKPMDADSPNPMVGSEKQIKWATDIKNDSQKHVNHIENFIKSSKDIPDKMRPVALKALSNAKNHAKFWIDARSEFNSHSSSFDVREDRSSGTKMAQRKNERFLEEHISKYVK